MTIDEQKKLLKHIRNSEKSDKKLTKTGQTCQKAREKWQKLSANKPKVQKPLKKAQTQNENNKWYNIVQAVKSLFLFSKFKMSQHWATS